jgi:hypothetical protein
MERANEIVRDSHSHNTGAQWPELVSRAVNDLSRIVHAEVRLAEIGLKRLIEQEIDRALKVVIALAFVLCATACAVGAALIGLHLLFGLWWEALVIVAAISGVAGIGLFVLAARRHEPILPD